MTKTWHVIYTNPKCEPRALKGLVEAGFDVYFPMMRVDKKLRHRRKGGRTTTIVVEKAMFPRYLFVSFEPGCSWLDLRRADGVESVLMSGEVPAVVSDAVIEDLRVAIDMGLFNEVKNVKAIFEPGTDVRIEEGPFMGFAAVVKRAMPGKMAEVLTSMFGRQTLITLSLEDIRRAA